MVNCSQKIVKDINFLPFWLCIWKWRLKNPPFCPLTFFQKHKEKTRNTNFSTLKINSLGVNCSGRGPKIKAQPPLHKRFKGEGKSYTKNWSKNNTLPNQGIVPTNASSGGRSELADLVLAIRARSAMPTGCLRNFRFKPCTIAMRGGVL